MAEKLSKSMPYGACLVFFVTKIERQASFWSRKEGPAGSLVALQGPPAGRTPHIQPEQGTKKARANGTEADRRGLDKTG
jgi:hypothetical protein